MAVMVGDGPKPPVSSFSFVIAHEIGWSFGNITKPFKSLVRTFKSPNQLSYTLLLFICLWLLKPLTRLCVSKRRGGAGGQRTL